LVLSNSAATLVYKVNPFAILKISKLSGLVMPEVSEPLTVISGLQSDICLFEVDMQEETCRFLETI